MYICLILPNMVTGNVDHYVTNRVNNKFDIKLRGREVILAIGNVNYYMMLHFT